MPTTWKRSLPSSTMLWTKDTRHWCGVSDAAAKKLQEQIAGGKLVKLVKVRCSAARMLTPQPQLHAADAPWRLTLLKGGEPQELYVMSWENWSLQSEQ